MKGGATARRRLVAERRGEHWGGVEALHFGLRGGLRGRLTTP